jgi:hypothetical protein
MDLSAHQIRVADDPDELAVLGSPADACRRSISRTASVTSSSGDTEAMFSLITSLTLWARAAA